MIRYNNKNYYELPDWIKYIATDYNGRIYGYETEPHTFGGVVWVASGTSKIILIDYLDHVCTNFEDTLCIL